jgi:sec-independent protein translocase protein TatC
VVFALGLFVALPVILYQLWAFIVPGTHAPRTPDGGAVHRLVDGAVHPRRIVAYLTLPHALEFLLGFAGDKFTNLISGSSFIGFVWC